MGLGQTWPNMATKWRWWFVFLIYQHLKVCFQEHGWTQGLRISECLVLNTPPSLPLLGLHSFLVNQGVDQTVCIQKKGANDSRSVLNPNRSTKRDVDSVGERAPGRWITGALPAHRPGLRSESWAEVYTVGDLSGWVG